jgi:hypothetical protein
VTFGLRPRPKACPEEVAAITAIAQALLTPTVVEATRDKTPAYRFSGRWFNSGLRR